MIEAVDRAPLAAKWFVCGVADARVRPKSSRQGSRMHAWTAGFPTPNVSPCMGGGLNLLPSADMIHL